MHEMVLHFNTTRFSFTSALVATSLLLRYFLACNSIWTLGLWTSKDSMQSILQVIWAATLICNNKCMHVVSIFRERHDTVTSSSRVILIVDVCDSVTSPSRCVWISDVIQPCYINCGIRHVTVPIATRILIANVRHIGLSNICVINLVYFKMQVWCLWNRYKATVMLNCSQYGASRLK